LELFDEGADLIVEITEDYYFNGNDKVLPRSIATREAFMNAMTLDIGMGGSTNTILHLAGHCPRSRS
jgi:dihydroxy-acid dehydratase